MKINAEAIVARLELNEHNLKHPAYLLAKFMIDHDAPSQAAIDATREWMAMSGYYKGPWSWAGVQAVLDMYTEVEQ